MGRADDPFGGQVWGPPWAHGGWGRNGPPPALRFVVAAVLAVVQVGGSLGATHAQPGSRPMDGWSVLLLLAAPVGLVLLPRAPWLAAPLTGVATAVFLATGGAFGPVVLGLAIVLLVTVVRGDRLLAWGVASGVVTATALTRWGAGEVRWQGLGAMVAWTGVVLAVGELIRVRRDRSRSTREALAERRRRQAGDERLRIARELHDVVAHHLSLINVQAAVALHLAERRPEHVEPALQAIKDASKDALTELRSLIDVLRDEDHPAPRAPAPTLASITDIIDRSAHAGLHVTRTVVGDPVDLPAAVELAAYRIVQEAVTNVVRHARATRATIRVGYGAQVLTLQVDDDGHGTPGAATLVPGNGLRGMTERAAALGGSLRVQDSPEGGLRVEATLPLGDGT